MSKFGALLGALIALAIGAWPDGVSRADPAVPSEALCDAQPWVAKCEGQQSYLERLKAYGLPPLQALGVAHRKVVRVFFDKASNPFPAITIERLPSGRGRLSVVTYVERGPRRWKLARTYATGIKVERTANLSASETQSLFAEASAVFDTPAPVPVEEGVPDSKGVSWICVDPSAARVEVAAKRGVVSRERLSCADSPVWSLAMRMGKLALAKLPPCDRITGPSYFALQDCAKLSGVLGPAVDVWNVDWSPAFHETDDPGSRDRFRALLTPSAVLRWRDEPVVSGSAAVTAAFDRHIERWGSVEPWLVKGLSPTAVRADETVEFDPDPGRDRIQAPMTVLWRLDADHHWRIDRIDVGEPFKD